MKGELDNLAFSLSGEYGWRFNLCDQFFVEPQVELTYTYIDSDDFTSAGAKFDFDSSDSLIGRAGLAAGWKLPDDRGDLYIWADVERTAGADLDEEWRGTVGVRYSF